MKRLFLFFITLAFLLSCNQKKIEQLQRENDSLRNLVQQSDFTLQQYLAAFNEIQENLNRIKEKENIITIQTEGAQDSLPEDIKEQINQDILTIYQLLEENRQKLKQLKQQLRRANIKNKELLKTIQLYEEQLRLKDQEINKLKQKLAELNINIQELNKEIAQLRSSLDTMRQIQEQQQQKIREQDILLHTAYYVVATKRDLIDHGVLTRQGLLAKLSLSGDFDRDFFTKIDTREVTEIPIYAKKIQILTPHPSSSYELKQTDKVIEALVIKDPDAFWETSKFLVIMVK